MLLKGLVEFAILSCVVGSVKAAGNEVWDYGLQNGPEKWHMFWEKCKGSRQSPIDIHTNMVNYHSDLKNITFKNYNTTGTGVNFTISNNGHTFSVSFAGYTMDTVPSISGGGLPGTFKLIGFHFHWGENSSRGSEHVVNGNSYPAELHLVHQNTKYQELSVAIEESDGLAVLGLFIKEGQTTNNVFENFLNMTKYNITFPGASSRVTPFPLMSFFPAEKTFYRYNGSLTTPQCQESVTWTVFENHIEISREQLAEFRKMKYYANNSARPLVDTYRPPQPINGRRVLANFEVKMPNTTMDPTTLGPTTLGPTTLDRTTLDRTTLDRTTMETTLDGNEISGNVVLTLTSVLLVFLTFLGI